MMYFEVHFATVILSVHTLFIVNLLWMDQLSQNWWPKWRVFDILDDCRKSLDQYVAQKCKEALKVEKKRKKIFQILGSNKKVISYLKSDYK